MYARQAQGCRVSSLGLCFLLTCSGQKLSVFKCVSSIVLAVLSVMNASSILELCQIRCTFVYSTSLSSKVT